MKTPNGEVERHRSSAPRMIWICSRGADQLQLQAVGIGKRQNCLVEHRMGFLKLHLMLCQSLLPVREGLLGCGKGCDS